MEFHRKIDQVYEAWMGLLLESYVDKQVNKAAKYIEANHKRLIGLEKTQAGNPKTAKDLANDVKNQMPVLVSSENGAKPGKFIQGAARIFYGEVENGHRDVSAQLSRYIKTLIDDGHSDEFDENLNGLSFDQLEDTFRQATAKHDENERGEFANREWKRNGDYEVVRIGDTEEAKPYRQYLNPSMPWCITASQQYYDSYTQGGAGLFYFVLKRGYREMKPEKGPDHPHDPYGESMIAVAVGPDGNLLNCTSRWNGSGDFMTARQLSELIGANFYDVFKPRPFEEIIEKYQPKRLADRFTLANRFGYMIYRDSTNTRKYGIWCKLIKPIPEEGRFEWAFYRATKEPGDDGAGKQWLYSPATGKLTTNFHISEYGYNDIPNLPEDEPQNIFIPATVIYVNGGILVNAKKIVVETGNRDIYISNGVLYQNSSDKYVNMQRVGLVEEKTAYVLGSIPHGKDIVVEPGTVALWGHNVGNDVETLSLPEGLRSIYQQSFESCGKLKSVSFPSTLKDIGTYSFAGTGLESVDIRGGVMVGNRAFSNCKSLFKVRVDFTGVYEYAIEMFFGSDCRNVEITGGNFIPAGCFSDTNVSSLKLPGSLEIIYEKAFTNCKSLVAIDLPDGVKQINDMAFQGCSNLKTIGFPSTLTHIGSRSFADCAFDFATPFPSTLYSIGDGAFDGCSQPDAKPVDVVLPNLMLVKYGVFAGCAAIGSVYMPQCVGEIQDTAFENCRNLEEINFPNRLHKFGRYSFAGCDKLKRIYVQRECYNGRFSQTAQRRELKNRMGCRPNVRFIPYDNDSELPFVQRRMGGTRDIPSTEPPTAGQPTVESFIRPLPDGYWDFL